MTSRHLLVAALAVLAISAVVDARVFHDDLSSAPRTLLQVNQRCPAGCATDGCVLDATTGGYKCMKCQNELVVNPDNGKCACPPGRYASGTTCVDCEKNYYCEGGDFNGTAPTRTDCISIDAELTTIGQRSTSIKACVNVPGSFYSVDLTTGNPAATTCPVNTYGPGLRKQRACVPCPPGYITRSTGSIRVSSCVVPEGYYLKGPGQVAPCPKGEWKTGFEPAPACNKCAAGVTTANEASTVQSACAVLLPSYYAVDIDATGFITSTKKCPQKYFCQGGTPTAKFDPASPTTGTSTTVEQCTKGLWTQNIGSISADQCLTPPGYFTDATSTTECADGSYRADWKPAAAAGSCNLCGANIKSNYTDQIAVYDISTLAELAPQPVRAGAEGCYILPGQGMYFNPTTQTYRATNCNSSNYGVAAITQGRAAYPCRDCPAGMETGSTASNAYLAPNGYTNPLACATKAGYGWNGRVATPCPAGSYNAAGNYGTCTQCAPGMSTVLDPTQQTAVGACVIAQGYGFYSNQITPCPIGTYRQGLAPNTTAACDSCPTGFTTPSSGGISSADCNLCEAGYGGASCATQCTGAKYGPTGRSSTSPACVDCPLMISGFSFDYLAENKNFTPATVARTGADSAADCLAEFAQIVDAAWYMDGSVNLTDVGDNTTTFEACVANCQGDANCQYITYNYDAAAGAVKCQKKTVVAGTSGNILAFKAVVAGDTTAASIKKAAAAKPVATTKAVAAAKPVAAARPAGVAKPVAAPVAPKGMKAKSLASGSYTFWKDNAANIGFDQVANAANNIQDCLSACDDDAGCAAVAMTNVKSNWQVDASIDSCKLIHGNTAIAQWKRSMTKAVVNQLDATSAV